MTEASNILCSLYRKCKGASNAFNLIRKASYSSNSHRSSLYRYDDDYQVNFEFAKNTGFDLVLERATNVVKAITERNLAKVLHIHCGGKLVDHFGQVNFDFHEGQ